MPITKISRVKDGKKWGGNQEHHLEMIYLSGPLHLQGALEWAVVYTSLKFERDYTAKAICSANR